MIHVKILFLCTLCTGTAIAETWQLSERALTKSSEDSEVSQTYNEPKKPAPLEPTNYYTKKVRSLLSFKNAHTALDYGAFAYALYHVGILYKNPSPNPANQSLIATFLKKNIEYICPTFIKQTGSQAIFICQALGVIGETLLYKTIAKLILLCGDGDILDVLKTKYLPSALQT